MGNWLSLSCGLQNNDRVNLDQNVRKKGNKYAKV